MVVLAYLVLTVFCFHLRGWQAYDTKTGGNFNRDYGHCPVTFPSSLQFAFPHQNLPFSQVALLFCVVAVACFVLGILRTSCMLRQTLSGWLCDPVKTKLL